LEREGDVEVEDVLDKLVSMAARSNSTSFCNSSRCNALRVFANGVDSPKERELRFQQKTTIVKVNFTVNVKVNIKVEVQKTTVSGYCMSVQSSSGTGTSTCTSYLVRNCTLPVTGIYAAI
jgi:ABC-type transport system involved in Fe-S cluster assembly fused permease/ATPase subunit